MITKKKLLFTFFLLTFLLTLGIGLFLYTFDLNNYKGYITDAVERIVQADVSIEHISLVFLDGIKFNLKNVVIGDRKASEDYFRVSDLALSLNVISWATGKFIVKKVILIDPFVRITRTNDGRIYLFPSLSGGGNEGGLKNIIPFFKKFVIKGGTIVFYDHVNKGEEVVKLSALDLSLKKSFLRDSYTIGLKGNISKNEIDGLTSISIKAKVSNMIKNDMFSLRDISIAGDLDIRSFNSEGFKDYYPQYMPAGVFPVIDINAVFDGKPFKKFTSSGSVVLYNESVKGKRVFLDPNRFHKALISYKLNRDNDLLDIEEFKLSLGTITMKSRLQMRPLSLTNKFILFDVDSLSLGIKDLKMIAQLPWLSKWAAGTLRRVSNGRITAGSMRFSGTWDQLKKFNLLKDYHTIHGRIRVSGLSFLPEKQTEPVKGIVGDLSFRDGIFRFSEFSFSYGDLKVKDVTGLFKHTLGKESRIEGSLNAEGGIEEVSNLIKLFSSAKKDIFPQGFKRASVFTDSMAGGFNLDLAFSGDPYDVKSLLYKGKLSLKGVNMPIKDDIRLLNGAGRFSFNEKMIDAVHIKGEAGGLSFHGSGSVKGFNEGKLAVSIELSSKIPVSMLDSVSPVRFQGSEGTFDPVPIEIFAEGGIDKISIKTLMNLTETPYKISGWIEKPGGKKSIIILYGDILDFKDIFIEKITIDAGLSAPIELKTNFYLKKPKHNIKLVIPKLDLAGVSEFISLLDKTGSFPEGHIEGELDIDWGTSGEKDINVLGSLEIDGRRIKIADKSPAVRSLKTVLAFNKKRISSNSLFTQLGESKIFLSGSVDYSNVPVIKASIYSPFIDFYELSGLLPKKSSDKKITIELSVDEGRYKKYLFKKLSAGIKVSSRDIFIKDANFESMDGYISTKGWIKRGESEGGRAGFSLGTSGNNINFSKFLEVFIPRLRRCLDGTLSFSSTLSGGRGNKGYTLRSLKGKFDFSVKGGVINKVEFAELGGSVKQKRKKEDVSNSDNGNEGKVGFDEISASFLINEGIASTSDFTLRVKGINFLTGAGNIDLGRELIDGVACYKQHVIIDTILKKIPIIGKLVTGKEKSVALKCVSLRGSLRSIDINEISPRSIGEKIIDVFSPILEIPRDIILMEK